MHGGRTNRNGLNGRITAWMRNRYWVSWLTDLDGGPGILLQEFCTDRSTARNAVACTLLHGSGVLICMFSQMNSGE